MRASVEQFGGGKEATVEETVYRYFRIERMLPERGGMISSAVHEHDLRRRRTFPVNRTMRSSRATQLSDVPLSRADTVVLATSFGRGGKMSGYSCRRLSSSSDV